MERRWQRPAGALAASAATGVAGAVIVGHPTFGRILLFAATVALVQLLAYVGAARATGTAVRPWLLGTMVGANAGADAILAWALVDAFGPGWLGMVAGGLLGLVVLAACLPRVSRDARYQAVVGAANLVLPTSWPVVAIGLVMLVATLTMGVTGARRPRLAFRLHLDRRTATLFVVGGLVGSLIPRYSTGFDMGNIAFTRANAPDLAYLLHHETGHTLSLAALGSAFHALGAIDENLVKRGARAYAEMLAESHVPVEHDVGNPIVSLWGR
jgi:hypothetical protein